MPSTLVSLLVTLLTLILAILVLGMVYWLLDLICSHLPLPEPFRWVAKIIPPLIVLILVLIYLLPLAGM